MVLLSNIVIAVLSFMFVFMLNVVMVLVITGDGAGTGWCGSDPAFIWGGTCHGDCAIPGKVLIFVIVPLVVLMMLLVLVKSWKSLW